MKERDSEFIPNSFQTPNAYVDGYLHLLTGEEWKTLTYAIRRILGFQKRRDRISYSQFAGGIVDSDGNRLDWGCGLSVDTLRRTLANLTRYGFLIRTADNDPRTNEGAEYGLQLDDSRIARSALLARGREKREANRKRTRKAVRVLLAKRARDPLLSDRTRPPIVGQNAPPIVGQKDNNQGNPEKSSTSPATTAEIEVMSVAEALQLPEIQLYKKVTNRIPGDAQWTIIVEFMREHEPTEEQLRPCWKAWNKQAYRPGGLGWLDWVLTGIPDFTKRNGNGKKKSNPPAKKTELTEEQWEETYADADRQFGKGA